METIAHISGAILLLSALWKKRPIIYHYIILKDLTLHHAYAALFLQVRTLPIFFTVECRCLIITKPRRRHILLTEIVRYMVKNISRTYRRNSVINTSTERIFCLILLVSKTTRNPCEDLWG